MTDTGRHTAFVGVDAVDSEEPPQKGHMASRRQRNQRAAMSPPLTFTGKAGAKSHADSEFQGTLPYTAGKSDLKNWDKPGASGPEQRQRQLCRDSESQEQCLHGSHTRDGEKLCIQSSKANSSDLKKRWLQR